MAYEVIILGHLHMPLYFLGTFTEYPYLHKKRSRILLQGNGFFFVRLQQVTDYLRKPSSLTMLR